MSSSHSIWHLPKQSCWLPRYGPLLMSSLQSNLVNYSLLMGFGLDCACEHLDGRLMRNDSRVWCEARRPPVRKPLLRNEVRIVTTSFLLQNRFVRNAQLFERKRKGGFVNGRGFANVPLFRFLGIRNIQNHSFLLPGPKLPFLETTLLRTPDILRL